MRRQRKVCRRNLGNVYAGFHPAPQQGHCPCTHLADVVGWFYKQCAAETRIYRSGFDKEQPECSKTIAARPPPRAGGVPPPTGCFASGENEKRRRENTFSRPSFFAFSLCPWGLFCSFLSRLSAGKQIPWLFPFSDFFSPCGRKNVRASIQPLRLLGAGRNSLPQGYRGRAVPCSVIASGGNGLLIYPIKKGSNASPI